MKKIVTAIIILLITTALLSSSLLLRVSALDSTNSPAASVNSASTLRIDIFDNNGINNSVSFSIDDIYAMPKTIVSSDLSCYGRLIESGQWGGVSLRVLLAEAGYTDQTANLRFYASDGYTTTLTLSGDTPQDVIVAYELEGSPLPEILRLVIPNANGEAWISMITSISINSQDYVSSPNPDAAEIVTNHQTLQQTITPQPSPTQQPRDQPIPQPTAQPPTNQPAQHQSASSSNLPQEYVYPIVTGTFATLATAAIGYLFYKRRK